MSPFSLLSFEQFHTCRKIPLLSPSRYCVSLRKGALSDVQLCCPFPAVNHSFIITLELLTAYIATQFQVFHVLLQSH